MRTRLPEVLADIMVLQLYRHQSVQLLHVLTCMLNDSACSSD